MVFQSFHVLQKIYHLHNCLSADTRSLRQLSKRNKWMTSVFSHFSLHSWLHSSQIPHLNPRICPKTTSLELHFGHFLIVLLSSLLDLVRQLRIFCLWSDDLSKSTKSTLQVQQVLQRQYSIV